MEARSPVRSGPTSATDEQWAPLGGETTEKLIAGDYTTRVATRDDVVAVDALLQASYPRLMASAYEEPVLAPALRVMTKANPLLLGSGTYYVAEARAGFLVGCGGWTAERPGTNSVEAKLAHIRHFATHPDWTKRGIGRTIYALCENAASEGGVTSFECYASLNAEAFYSALGFERIRAIDVELGPNVVLPGVLMRRQI